MAKKLLAPRKSSKAKRKAPSRPRARKNPAAWKFAVAVPVVAGVGYLLYKYVFMNEAQAAELVEGSGTATQTPAAQIPASSTGTSPQVPASGSAPSGAEGAGGPAGPGGATTIPGTTPAAPRLPTSGQACFAGIIGGMNIKIKLVFDAKGAKGVVSKNGQEVSKISTNTGGMLTSHVGDPEVRKLFRVRWPPILVTDAGMSHNGWTLARTVC